VKREYPKGEGVLVSPIFACSIEPQINTLYAYLSGIIPHIKGKFVFGRLEKKQFL
jgi:hypothetical protein